MLWDLMLPFAREGKAQDHAVTGRAGVWAQSLDSDKSRVTPTTGFVLSGRAACHTAWVTSPSHMHHPATDYLKGRMNAELSTASNSTNIYWTPAMCLVLHCTLTAPEWMGHNSFITRWLQPRESIFHHFTIAIPSVMFCKLERAQYVWSHRVNWLLLPHVSILCYNYSISLIIWQTFFSDSHVKLWKSERMPVTRSMLPQTCPTVLGFYTDPWRQRRIRCPLPFLSFVFFPDIGWAVS